MILQTISETATALRESSCLAALLNASFLYYSLWHLLLCKRSVVACIARNRVVLG